MAELIDSVLSWQSLSGFLFVLVAFGFAPGFVLRTLVKIYPQDDPRRAELLAQLYVLRHLERPLFVAQQCETVLFEGLPHRIQEWRRRRASKPARKSVDHSEIRAVIRKIVITTIVGAISFPFTQLIFSTLPGQLVLTVAFGSIVLLIQFLVDFEKRLAKVEIGQAASLSELTLIVERGLSEIHAATQRMDHVDAAGPSTVAVARLAEHSRISQAAPRLVHTFAQFELDRLARLLGGLVRQGEVYGDGCQDWLPGLMQSATKSVDVVCVLPTRAARNSVSGFWDAQPGGIAGGWQREAVRRDVKVRWVLVAEHDDMMSDSAVQSFCHAQTELGIGVRVLCGSALPHVNTEPLRGFILFDDTISCELRPAWPIEPNVPPMTARTRIVSRADWVEERVETYRHIWQSATAWHVT
jgi:hypothetical protein